jgi:DNA-binding response OmpR family regulator
MKVLLVDEKIEVANQLLEGFKAAKIECWTKTSALGALELLETNHFDVIVTTMNLPHLHSMSFAQIAKEKYKIPVIVTASTYPAQNSNSFDAFILEPYDFSELLELIQMLAKPQLKTRPAEIY